MKNTLIIPSFEKLISWPQNRRIAFISNIEWVKQVIQSIMMAKILSEIGNIEIILIDYSKTFKPEVLENIGRTYHVDLINHVSISDHLNPNIGGKISLHIHNPSENKNAISNFRENVLKTSSLYTIVTDVKPSKALHGLRGILRVYCTRISQDVFSFKTFTKKITLKLSSKGMENIYDTLSEGLKKALKILQKASVEYGPLTVGDAVTIISHDLNIQRSMARRILIKLARHGVIRVEKNSIII